MSNDLQLLYDERLTLFQDTVRRRPTQRVPLQGSSGGYMLADGGYPFGGTLRNWDMMHAAVVSYANKYQFDALFYPGIRNPIAIAEALGTNNYKVDDEAYSLHISDYSILEADEYDEIIADRIKFLWQKGMPRKFPGATKEMVLQSFGEFLKFGQFAGSVEQILKDECGCVKVSNLVASHPVEMLFNGYRGIRGLSLDLRRQPEKVMQYCDSVQSTEALVESLEQQLQQSVGGEHVFDVFIAFLAQTAMSTTMFRDMYWPMVQAVIDLVLRYDGTIVLFMEGDNTRLWDFFKDIPRGHAALWLEQDDMFAAKQVLGGNLTLVGGYPVDLLANGSVQQCLDYAQRCVDELADDCGWIFTFDKGLSFKRDAKPENLAAVMQFMHEASI